MDDNTIPDDTHLAAPLDLAVLNVAAGNGTHAGDLVGLAHLGMADESLPELGGQHTLHGSLHLVDGVVDNPVHPHIHVAAGGAVPGGGVRPYVEAHDNRLGGSGQHHVAFVDGAYAGVDHPDTDLLVGDLLQAGLYCLGGALNIGLDDDIEILHLTGLDLAEQILQADLLDRRIGLGLLLGLALLYQLTGQTLVGHGVEGIACAGHFAQAGDLHRHRGTSLGEAAALVVHHGPDTAHGSTGNDNISLMESTILNQQSSHRATALVQTGLDDRTGGGTVGVSLQLRHLGSKGHHLQQVIDTHTSLGGNGADNGLAAPVLGHQLILSELLLDTVGVGLGLIHLVDGHDNGDAGSLGVVDRLHGLGLDTVLGSHHQDGDIRDHGAPGTHGGKCLMAGGVQEGNGLAVNLHLIGADMLGNAAGLTGGHMGVADIVQEGGLAVVHVAHNHHHGGTRHQILFLVLAVVDELLLDGDHDFLLHLAAHFLGNNGGSIEINDLAEGGHDTVLHQALDHLGAGLLHPAGQLTHGDLRGNLHRERRLFGNLQLKPTQLLRLFLLALVGKRLLVALLLSGVAELLLALVGIPHTATAAVCQILELLVILIQVDIGSLPGIHHLGLGNPGHRLRLNLGLRLLLGLLALLRPLRLLPGAGMAALLLGPLLAILLRTLFLAALALLSGRLGRRRGRCRLLRRSGVGKNRLKAGNLVMLGQVFKYHCQLPLVQVLPGLFGSVKILAQDVNDLPGLQAKILCQLIHFILVYNTAQ